MPAPRVKASRWPGPKRLARSALTPSQDRIRPLNDSRRTPAVRLTDFDDDPTVAGLDIDVLTFFEPGDDGHLVAVPSAHLHGPGGISDFHFPSGLSGQRSLESGRMGCG
ncbi:MAG: hypothetical protein JJU22_16595 [Gammaproteobacteria bacterium]|nr:hypothetical protein [Gammaproteobacteria bacterium]